MCWQYLEHSPGIGSCMDPAGMAHFVFICGLTQRKDLNGRLATLDQGVWRSEGRAVVDLIGEQAVPDILRDLVETGHHNP